MRVLSIQPDFPSWQAAARRALDEALSPDDVLWQDAESSEPTLDFVSGPASKTPTSTFRVPKDFLPLAETVACHRDERRWALLYRVLWRLTHGEPNLLKIVVDPDVAMLQRMEKDIRRDVHKMRAFVRFREFQTPDGEWFVSWFEPSHRIVERNAPFFVKRFASMRWSIFTPDRCAHWDRKKLRFTEGVTRAEVPADDAAENLWKTYYANIFNPARVKVKAMKSEMPVRYWKNLPEAALIPDLLREAPARVGTMIGESQSQTPRDTHSIPTLPPGTDIAALRTAAAACEACPLHRNATQTVFGEGPPDARIVVVGEQPGDREDRQGRPFIGPAGKLLDRAFAEAGIDRNALYLTNTVKHFKWEPRGKRRLHQKPSGRDIASCRAWLDAEIAAIRPERLLCLGATAAQAILGPDIRITRDRGREFRGDPVARVFVTVHPSSLLRLPPGADKETEFARFVDDLRRAVFVGTRSTLER